jgi:small subunit ribosomal protein S6
MARDYELGIILNPDIGDDQARAIVERVTQTIATDDGQVVRVNAWGRRRLAYPIEHHRDGLYFFFDLILNPEATSELEHSIRVNEDILRHLLKVRDPRVVAQQRQRDAEAEAQAAAQAAQAAAAAAEVPAATEALAAAEAEAPESVAESAESTVAPAAMEEEEAVTEAEDEDGEEESATAEAEV